MSSARAWFWCGLAVRLILMPLGGSHYLRDLFIPFVDSAILNLGSNPWSLNPPHFFPYGSVLFGLLFIPKFLGWLVLGELALGQGALSLFLMKLPLLLADLLMLRQLKGFAKGRHPQLFFFYWFNPILIYVSYSYGQLDLVAMFFLVTALAEILNRRIVPSALWMGCAILCKFHVVVAMPLVLAYIWNREFPKKALINISSWSAVALAVAVVGFAPLLMAERLLYASTSSPEAFRIFSLALELGGGAPLYFGIGILLLTAGRLCISSQLREEGLIFGTALLFGILILVTYPFPGWYLWVVPFVSLFFALYLNAPRIMYVAWVLLHPIYFIAFEPMVTSGEQGQKLAAGLAFTALQTTLIGLLITIWVLSVRRMAILERRGRPTAIGIAGDSGSGKNWLSRILAQTFCEKNTVLLEGDDYHRWERGALEWSEYTHLDPKANHLLRMAADTAQLMRGQAVMLKHYNHSTGRFDTAREILPDRTVIIQGLHTLYLVRLRDHFDLRIYIDPDPQLRRYWKIRRDTTERKQAVEAIVKTMENRAMDSEKHISPQSEFADWVIRYFSVDSVSDAQAASATGEIELGVRHIFWNDTPVGDLIEELRKIKECQVQLEHVPSEINRIQLVVRGKPSVEEIRVAASRLYPDLRHITRGTAPPVWSGGLDGVTQLLALLLIGQKSMRAPSSIRGSVL